MRAKSPSRMAAPPVRASWPPISVSESTRVRTVAQFSPTSATTPTRFQYSSTTQSSTAIPAALPLPMVRVDSQLEVERAVTMAAALSQNHSLGWSSSRLRRRSFSWRAASASRAWASSSALRCFSPASSSFICSSSKASLYFSSAQLVTAVMPLRTGVVRIPTRLDRGSATPPNSIDTTAVTRASRMAAIKIRIPLCRKKSFTSVRSLSLSRCPARPPPGAGSPRRAGAGCRPGGTRAGP